VNISIITPSYSQARYIRQTIDSVLRQTGDFELEHIVVDGSSADNTVAILRSYGDAIRWVSEPDEGQADALNKGIGMATGDIIGWLNSDDLYEPGCLAAVAQVFTLEPDTQWLYGRARIIDEFGREQRRWITWYKTLRMQRFSYQKLLTEDWIPQMGVFWRRSAGAAVGPFRKELYYAIDYDFWLRLGANWPGRYLDQLLGAFRWYRSSKTGRGYVESTREALQVAIENANGRYRSAIWWHRLNRAKIIVAYWLLDAIRFRTRVGH
jgi:glycosyltransferase involved in cell wall biosynthesis